jgi:hypothetical protein
MVLYATNPMVINDKQVYQPRLTDGFICVVLLINFITMNLNEYLKIKECILPSGGGQRGPDLNM